MNVVAVIDYGMGNLRSVSKALEHVAGDARVIVTHDPRRIAQADRVVFPGQGAARDCMAEIKRLGLDAVVREAVATKPFLGICMGLQVLLDCSEEGGNTPCLGIVAGSVRRFPERMAGTEGGAALKIPHMGWNEVHQTRPHPLWQGIAQDSRFYFVHSYYCVPAQDQDVAGVCQYGRPFAAVLARGNLFAAQFHPEKSQHAGLTLLTNFMSWDGAL